MPNAIPMAAKIPANLAISNGGAAAGLAAAGSTPSAGAGAGAAGRVVGAALILAVALAIIFESFSAALLLIKFSTATDILRYGLQNACATLIGLSTTLVITASHSTPALS